MLNTSFFQPLLSSEGQNCWYRRKPNITSFNYSGDGKFKVLFVNDLINDAKQGWIVGQYPTKLTNQEGSAVQEYHILSDYDDTVYSIPVEKVMVAYPALFATIIPANYQVFAQFSENIAGLPQSTWSRGLILEESSFAGNYKYLVGGRSPHPVTGREVVEYLPSERIRVALYQGTTSSTDLIQYRPHIPHEHHQHILPKQYWHFKWNGKRNAIFDPKIHGSRTKYKMHTVDAMEFDGSLVKFRLKNQSEFWSYRGSYHIKQIRQYAERHGYSGGAELCFPHKSYGSSNLQVVTAAVPAYKPGGCNSGCWMRVLRHSLCERYIRGYMLRQSPLLLPLIYSFKRKCIKDGKICYKTPCVNHISCLATMEYVRVYLQDIEAYSHLSIHNFCFQSDVDIFSSYLPKEAMFTHIPVCCDDVSNGQENIHIPLVSSAPLPPYFEYIRSCVRICTAELNAPLPPPPRGCDCSDNCQAETCECRRHTVLQNSKNVFVPASAGHRTCAGYVDGVLEEVQPAGVYECHDGCSCERGTCENRLVQHGVRTPLLITWTYQKGLSLLTLTDIPKGAFVCEYVGEVISPKESEAADSENTYLFEVDVSKMIRLFIHNMKQFDDDDGSSSSSPTPSSDTVSTDDSFFSEFRGSEASSEMQHFVIDARKRSNVARFINHSCDPNMFTQLAYTQGCHTSPARVAFFTSRCVKRFEELTINYHATPSRGNENGVPCRCRHDCPNKFFLV